MTETRTKLLDAAADIVVREGAQHLTLDAVAERAGVSKGGLLYHFRSKNALVEAMVERMVTEFDAAMEATPGQPRAVTRAYLTATIGREWSPSGDSESDRLVSALFAATLVEPSALEPLRAMYARWQERLEGDGIDPAVATLVRMAVDGWWLSRLAGLSPPGPDLHAQVFALLSDLIDREDS
ncbi:TetR/AcrR family transcriptional regulator [Allokutzneria sp. NRRL B-24872]|uniref:TetR/AcrR family transcriptional regulator n=1 Tax=Allokutzneria sp. NRRL B-24872 TaxID=1137961 RepID=UPI000A36E900|nr:TetR/AcrR family transcriptional regulator [Allokutzneria sp. NRRL B-24872]